MTILRLLFLFSCFFLYPILSFGQHYITNIKKFGLADGLSDQHVICTHKDANEMLWVGTTNGLNRLDRDHFKVYNKENNQLKYNRISKITSDQYGNLWLLYSKAFQTPTSIEVFNPITELSIQIENYVENELPFSVNLLIDFAYSPQNGLLFLIKDGSIYQLKDKKVQLFSQLPTDKKVKGILSQADGKDWFYSDRELFQLDTQGQLIQQIQSPLSIFKVIGFNQQKQPVYLVSDDKQVSTWNNYELFLYVGNQRLAQLPGYFYKDIIALDCANNWLYLVHQEQNVTQLVVVDTLGNILRSSSKQLSFDASALTYFKSEIWLGYPSTELQLIQTHQTNFKRYLHQHTSIHNTNYGVRAMTLLAENQLLVNGLGKSYVLHLKTGKYEQFGEQQKFYPDNAPPYFYNGLACLAGSNQQFWLTDELFRLVKFNKRSQSFQNYSYQGKLFDHLFSNVYQQGQFKHNPLMQWSLYEDQQGVIWVGHQNGLSYLDTTQEYLQVYQPDSNFYEFNKSSIYHFHKNETGIWLASSQGLYLFNPLEGIQARFHEKAETNYRIPHNHIVHIHEDQAGYFWLATKGGGLIQWHPKTKETKQFTTQQGLSHNVIYAIYEDDFGKLWLSSNRGIMRFDKQNHQVNTFLTRDGISAHEFNTISHYKAPDGTLFFGSVKGITSFHPKDFSHEKQKKYPIYLSTVKILDNKTGNFNTYKINQKGHYEIVLQPTDLGFTLDFVYPNYQVDHVQFAYKIDKLDKQWTYFNETQLRINRLPYGEHQLLIKAQGELGFWEAPQVITIQQLKPFYLQFWFIGLCILFILGCIIAFFRYKAFRYQQKQRQLEQIITARTLTIKEQADELRHLNQVKSKFFTNISHELRTPLTLILGPTTQLLNEISNTEHQVLLNHVKKNGEGLLKLVNEILDLTKLENHKLTLQTKPVHFHSFLNQVFSNYHTKASYQDVAYVIDFQASLDFYLHIDSAKVEQIISNLVSNAFKFTPRKGQIHCIVYSEGDQHRIVVKDNGIGIRPEDISHIFERYYQSNAIAPLEGGSGIGLSLAQELAGLMNGNIQVKSNYGKGTEFEFSFTSTPVSLHPSSEIASTVTANNIKTDHETIAIATSPSTHYRILIVEDLQDMVTFIRHLLKKAYQIQTACNGQEALEKLANTSELPDLIISDVMMPTLDGLSLIKALKKHETWRNIPIIVLTARTAIADKLDLLTLGIDDYLTKPFLPAELQARVHNLLINSAARSQYWQTESKQNNANEADTSGQPKLSQADLAWINQVEQSIKSQVVHKGFKLQHIAEQHHMSFRQFQRRVKKTTGMTPVKYQQEIQLQMSRRLLEQGYYRTVTELAYAVGFETSSYFSKLFEKRFGRKPIP